MALTNLERNFLPRLSTAPWASPHLFDRPPGAGYVKTEALPTGAVQYEIAGAGRNAVADLLT
jgi:hypothetical protein